MGVGGFFGVIPVEPVLRRQPFNKAGEFDFALNLADAGDHFPLHLPIEHGPPRAERVGVAHDRPHRIAGDGVSHAGLQREPLFIPQFQNLGQRGQFHCH